jgi:hypothetical protein
MQTGEPPEGSPLQRTMRSHSRGNRVQTTTRRLRIRDRVRRTMRSESTANPIRRSMRSQRPANRAYGRCRSTSRRTATRYTIIRLPAHDRLAARVGMETNWTASVTSVHLPTRSMTRSSPPRRSKRPCSATVASTRRCPMSRPTASRRCPHRWIGWPQSSSVSTSPPCPRVPVSRSMSPRTSLTSAATSCARATSSSRQDPWCREARSVAPPRLC